MTDHDDSVESESVEVRERPDCVKCGTKTKWIVYGFPSRMPTEEDDWVVGGCNLGFGDPEFECPACGYCPPNSTWEFLEE